MFVCSFVNVYFLLAVLILDKKANSVFMIPVRFPPACRRFPGFVFLFGEISCFSTWEIFFFSMGTGICPPIHKLKALHRFGKVIHILCQIHQNSWNVTPSLVGNARILKAPGHAAPIFGVILFT